MEPEELERSPLFVDRIIATDEAMSAVRGVTGISLTAINFTGTQGATFAGTVATFTDSTSGVYLATIYWGDGNQSSGVVASSAAPIPSVLAATRQQHSRPGRSTRHASNRPTLPEYGST